MLPSACELPMEWKLTTGRRSSASFAASLHYNLLGQAGCLQFFNADFRGEAREVILIANGSFPGQHI